VDAAHLIPNDPLVFIQDCVRGRRLFWTYHVNMRMQNRYIPRQTILDAVDHYEMIESYPEDKYLPSYLVLARDNTNIFHVLFATDLEHNNARIITSYRPDPSKWHPDFKTRRRKR